MWEIQESSGIQQQGSKEWHEFRSRHIGASEVPALMGTCDFKNEYQLWLDKTGIFKKEVNNFATQRGKDMEPFALAKYTEITGNETAPLVLEYNEFPALSASLDGWVAEKKIVVEVKCPSAKKHQMALCGEVPETYRDQLQTQMLVSGTNVAHYVSYAPGEPDGTNLAIVTVAEDKARQEEILAKVKSFWANVEAKTPPDGVSNQPELIHIINELTEVKNQLKVLDEAKEALEKCLKGAMKANTVMCEGFTLGWSERKGAVEYSSIPELKSVDLEKYRKSPIKVFTLKQAK